MHVTLVALTLTAAALAYVFWIRRSPSSPEVVRRVDELIALGYAFDLDLGIHTYRVVPLPTIGEVLLEIRNDASGYYSIRYNIHGEYIDSRFILSACSDALG